MNSADPTNTDLNYESHSLAMMQLHQEEGGRAARYLFESWYEGPYVFLPETQQGTYTHLALSAIKYIKGIADTNGTLEQLLLTSSASGATTNFIALKNLGDVSCLPALNAFESGATNISVRYFDSNNIEITSDILSPDGWSPTNLLAVGATLLIKSIATLLAQIGKTNRQVSIEAYWNPQDPTGIIRDNVLFSFGNSQPDPWAAQDIGGPGVGGSSLITNGTLTVNASGSDIWGTSDAFQFFYATRPGDGAISARVVSQQPVDPWSKAGVMMRDSLASNSFYAAFFVTPSNGITHQSRLTNGAASTTASTPGAAPYWVRLTRSGSSFQSYASTNGTNWTYWRTTTLAPGTNMLWGIAVTSHNNTQLCQVGVDNISLNSTPNVTTPTNFSVIAGATLIFTNSATDIDLPGQVLSWSRDAGPTNSAIIATNGIFIWRPPAASRAVTSAKETS